jgi:hypothetical protein
LVIIVAQGSVKVLSIGFLFSHLADDPAGDAQVAFQIKHSSAHMSI